MKVSLYEVMGVFFFTYQINYLFIIILNLISPSLEKLDMQKIVH
jgi:hypothetical protein